MAGPTPIFAPNYSVTGIRQYDAAQVLMTGTCPYSSTTPKPTRAMLYLGPMNPTDSSLCQCPDLPFRRKQEPPYSSVFYGPNTGPFNPSTGSNDVRAVGTYNYLSEPEILNHGMLYQGPADVSSDPQFWTTIDVPDNVADPTGNGRVINTLPHSTMGDLIVGNYQVTDAEEGEFDAFVYNMSAPEGQRYHRLKLQLKSTKAPRLVTAYGIWQNDGGTGIPPYTIAGGLFDDTKQLNVAYLVDYNPSSPDATITAATFNDGGPITHFEGISQCGNNGYGYSLAAIGDDSDAAFAQVVRNSDGSFPDNAVWVPVQAPSNGFITGNTVLTNNLFGIYGPCSASDPPNNCFFRSYAAAISGANCGS